MLQKLYEVQTKLDALVASIHNEVAGLSIDLIGQSKEFDNLDFVEPPKHFVGAIETQQLYTIRLLGRLYDEVKNLRGILHGEIEPVIGRPFNPTTEPVEKTEEDQKVESELAENLHLPEDYKDNLRKLEEGRPSKIVEELTEVHT